MEAKIIAIGNSRGIRIPKKVLEEYAIEDRVEIDLVAGGILLRPTTSGRRGWDEAFARMAERGDDAPLIADICADETPED